MHTTLPMLFILLSLRIVQTYVRSLIRQFQPIDRALTF